MAKTINQVEYAPEFLGKPIARPERKLDTIPWKGPKINIEFHSSELHTACPVTHQPDFYQFDLKYQPFKKLIESKSLKLYLVSWDWEPIFAEHLAASIQADIIETVDPSYVKVTLTQNVRGGLVLAASVERVIIHN